MQIEIIARAINHLASMANGASQSNGIPTTPTAQNRSIIPSTCHRGAPQEAFLPKYDMIKPPNISNPI
ncbi:MAG TPA: hypothetical protein PK429_01120 [Candidatus Pacearchaeota archaeon]|nr:hypothetical protein [Candidatus Pacearchaeota archaeon]HPO06549.1 hypothetical protein [Candidatus Pacearchaeota archaeon]